MKHKEYSKKIISFISKLNYLNNSRLWWSLNLSSKNPLSSNFLNDLFNLIDIIENNKNNYVNYKNHQELNNIQRKTILNFYNNKSNHSFKLFFFYRFLINFFKSFVLLLNSYFFGVFSLKKVKNSQILIFSFIDSRARKRKDTYFADLIDKIKAEYPQKTIHYLFHVYRPYLKNIQNLSLEKNPYSLILSYLKISDYLWCIKEVVNLYMLRPFIPKLIINKKKLDITLLIKDAMINEISTGLIDNLLIYRSFIRLNKNKNIETIIYPFENKSLEKLMLFALDGNIKTIGYQHSSITSRHFSLILEKEESKLIPLPDKIVTTGTVTKNWLINKGNFPKEIINVGVSLRNTNSKCLDKKLIKDNFKLLFAFSSSYNEVYKTINFLNKIKSLKTLSIRFRFHPDFPFSGLSQKSKQWLKTNQVDTLQNKLIEDFQWSDATCYISSSVAIESILHNVPVIQMKIDTLDCDPLLGEDLPLKWNANNQKDFFEIISIISKIDNLDQKEKYLKSKKFIDKYFISKKLLNVKTFM